MHYATGDYASGVGGGGAGQHSRDPSGSSALSDLHGPSSSATSVNSFTDSTFSDDFAEPWSPDASAIPTGVAILISGVVKLCAPSGPAESHRWKRRRAFVTEGLLSVFPHSERGSATPLAQWVIGHDVSVDTSSGVVQVRCMLFAAIVVLVRVLVVLVLFRLLFSLVWKRCI